MKIKIALAVDPKGNWSCAGWGNILKPKDEGDMMGYAIDTLEDGETRYWVEVDIELPTEVTIQGKAVAEDQKA